MLTVLRGRIADPRAWRGRGYELAAVLALVLFAVTCDHGLFVVLH